MARSLAILPGGSSPKAQASKPMYDMLLEEAKQLGWTAKIHSFVGDGHYPDMASGLELITNVVAIRSSLKGYPAGSTLFCRCYGCYVGAYVLAFYQKFVESFDRVVFWAPMPYWFMWKSSYADRGSLAEFNNYAETAGYRMNDNFFISIQPMERLVTNFPEKDYVFSCGTEDPCCNPADIRYLQSVMQRTTGKSAEVHVVSGAEHAVGPKSVKQIRNEYLYFIFKKRNPVK